MINCPNCNHQNPDGALQCEACYTPLPALATCPNCNASVQADASFCGQCGSDLREETLTPGNSQNINTEAAAPTQAVFPQTPEPESAADPDSGIQTQNFLVPPEGSSVPAPDIPEPGIPDLVPPDPLIIPEPINAVGSEESASTTGNLGSAYSGTELSSEMDPFAEAEPAVELTTEAEPAPFVEPPAAEPVASEPAVSEPTVPEPAVEPLATPIPSIRKSPATQLQIASVRLKQVQTDTIIELPRGLSVVRIGKPNDHTPPDIDVSGFPDSEIVSRAHASIRIEGDTYFLEDVGSSNGTYINGLPLPVGNRHRLRPGDRIALGKGDKVSFLFEIAS
ncbi:MAG: FHA domain-containing protein [Phormidesmis sp.]